MRIHLVFAAVLLLGVAGCDADLSSGGPAYSSVTVGSRPEVAAGPGHVVYVAVDRMLAEAPEVAPGLPLVVTSLTDTQHLDRSSRFGNLVAELVRSRLVQHGLSVAEPRLRSQLLLRRHNGEMMLSRHRRSLVRAPYVAGIVTGTYAVGARWIHASLRLISPDNARIVSAVDFAVPRYPDAEALLSAR